MLPIDSLHCLTVDFAHAPPALRAAFEFPADEIRDLLCLAGRDGLPLIVLCTPSALTLMSTSRHHLRAFRPVLARLRERGLELEGWLALRVRIASGSDAGRQLLRQAIPSTRFEPEIRLFVRSLRAAAELSGTCGAFSSELGALVRMTEHAADRVWDETRLGRPGSTEAEAELESLAAERIFEEELVSWQSSYPALRSTRRPPLHSDISQFTGEERESMVRIRVPNVLSKLRTA
ncbi:MAG: hypothetical protein ABW061_22740 [Polyangiaceae bacterium]